VLKVPADRVLPTHTDPVARAASTPIGGPWGRHAVVGRQWLWTPVRVLLAMALLTLAFGWLQKAPCQSANWSLSQPVLNTQTHQLQTVDGKQYVWLCYSDIIPLYGGEGLDHNAVPYRDHAVEYPVLTGWFMYTAAEIGRGYDHFARKASSVLPYSSAVETYYEVTVLMLVICALVMVWACAGLAGRRVWDAAMVAFAPLLIVHAFTNWDLFAVALGTAGMLAWSKRRAGLAGVLIGLGTAAKLYPVFLLGPLLVLCVRARKLGEFARCLFFVALAWAVVNVPVAVAWTPGWNTFFTNNADRGADPDTIWNVAQYAAGKSIPVGLLNTVTVVLFVLACAAIAVLGLSAQRRPRWPQLCFLVVAAFLLTNKVWSPQYSLWLIPLAVLARPSWRIFICWQAAEALLWFPRMYWLFQTSQNAHSSQDHLQVLVRGIDEKWFLLAVVLRDVLVVLYGVLIVRDILMPEQDLIRRSGMDDPAGGVLDGVDPEQERRLELRHPVQEEERDESELVG